MDNNIILLLLLGVIALHFLKQNGQKTVKNDNQSSSNSSFKHSKYTLNNLVKSKTIPSHLELDKNSSNMVYDGNRRENILGTGLFSNLTKDSSIPKNHIPYNYELKLIKPAYTGDLEETKIMKDEIEDDKRIISINGYINGELSAISTTTFKIV